MIRPTLSMIAFVVAVWSGLLPDLTRDVVHMVARAIGPWLGLGL